METTEGYVQRLQFINESGASPSRLRAFSARQFFQLLKDAQYTVLVLDAQVLSERIHSNRATVRFNKRVKIWNVPTILSVVGVVAKRNRPTGTASALVKHTISLGL